MGCIFKPEALSWEDIDGGRGELTLEAIRNFISEYCYHRTGGGLRRPPLSYALTVDTSSRNARSRTFARVAALC